MATSLFGLTSIKLPTSIAFPCEDSHLAHKTKTLSVSSFVFSPSKVRGYRNVKSRSPSLTCCVATSVESGLSAEEAKNSGIDFDERKRIAEQNTTAKPYRIKEVETIGQQEYNSASVISVDQVSPNVRCITVDAEVSRELLALENAYTKPGQTVKIKLQNGDVVTSYVSSAPFPEEMNANVLLKMRGDIPAGSTKLPQVSLSVRAPLGLHVPGSSPLYNLQPGDEIIVGPFEGGLDLRPIMFLSRFPTLLIFASGDGIATARSLIEAADIGSLNLHMRQDVRLYYSADKPSELAYQNLFGKWGEKLYVRATVNSKDGENWDGFVGSFSQLFDEDDLEYDPLLTAAVVCVRKADKDSVTALLKEAGIDEKNVIYSEL